MIDYFPRRALLCLFLLPALGLTACTTLAGRTASGNRLELQTIHHEDSTVYLYRPVSDAPSSR